MVHPWMKKCSIACVYMMLSFELHGIRLHRIPSGFSWFLVSTPDERVFLRHRCSIHSIHDIFLLWGYHHEA